MSCGKICQWAIQTRREKKGQALYFDINQSNQKEGWLKIVCKGNLGKDFTSPCPSLQKREI